MALYALQNIKSNPFRDLTRCPVRPDKVAALKESITETGFWNNVLARECDGGAEIAYGHHRLTALNEVYGPDYKVNLNIEKLTNEQMLKIMARENMEDWGSNASILHETVYAVVKAYGEGRITLPAFPKSGTNKRHIRIAPSFKPIDYKGDKNGPSVIVTEGSRAYTIQSLAEFVGWVQPNGEAQGKVVDVLNALELIEDGLLSRSVFEGKSTMQAREIIARTREKVKRQKEQEKARAEAAQSATNTAPQTATANASDTAPNTATNTAPAQTTPAKKDAPDIHKYEFDLARDINRILDFDDPLIQRLDQLVKFKNDLLDGGAALAKTLENVAYRFHSYANKFRKPNVATSNEIIIEGMRVN